MNTASQFALMARGITDAPPPKVTDKAPTVTYKGKPTAPKWCITCNAHMPHAAMRGKWVCGVCGTQRDA